MLALGAVSLIVGVSIWFARSTLVPFADERAISYVLCTPSGWQLLAWLVASFVALAGLRRLLARSTPHSSFLFLPLALVGLNTLALGLLSPALRDWWAPVAYVGATAYPIVWLTAIGLTARNVWISREPAVRDTVVRWWPTLGGSGQSLLIDVGLAALVAGLVIASSPKIRFSAAPLGDEPKYLRYAENWWQGRGMDMDGVRDASDIPASAEGPHFLRNFAGLGPALARDVSQLAADVRYLGNSKHWGHQFNQATYVGNWFVTGRNGGLYQIHQPGISVVILPAYAVDRWLFDGGRARFADDLFAVNTVMLLIYLAVACTTFRLVDRFVRDRVIAAAAAIACVASLPLSSFVFTFYPEMLGALLVAAVAYRATSKAPATARSGALAGAALGWLVWLQVRFAVLGGVLFLWTLWNLRRDRRAWAPLIVLSGGLVALFCFYVYHVTGSVLPGALYAATPDPGFGVGRLTVGLPGILFDRENGLFALAPAFLLALPGLGLMLRSDPRTAVLVVSLLLALMIPVAGHGYETSGTSPLRHMVAVIPLLAVPVGVWLRAIRGRALLTACAAALLLTSMLMAAAYNHSNDKARTQTYAAGVSGWDPSFVFPLLQRTDHAGFDRRALALWEFAAIAAVGFGFWSGARPAREQSRTGALAMAAALGGLSLVGLLAIQQGGPARSLRLLETPQQSLRECRRGCTGAPGVLQVGTIPERVVAR